MIQPGHAGPVAGAPVAAIDAVEVIPVRIPLAADPAGAAAHEAVIVVLHAGDFEGVGEGAALGARGAGMAGLAAELAAVAASLPGANPADLLDRDGWPELSPAAGCALETALLDLVGRLQQRRVADLLGGAARSTVECNALLDGASPAAVVAEVRAAGATGYSAFKLKASQLWPVSPSQAIRFELERLAAARWAAGTDARLRLDFNGALDTVTCELALSALTQADLELVEQPLAASAGPSDWAALAAWSRTSLAADESLADAATARALAVAGVGLAIKLSTVGGPRAAMALAASAPPGTPVLLSSSMDTTIGIAAAVHVACALGRAPLACGLATRSRLVADLASGLGTDAPWLTLPSGAGLGVAVDRAALETYRVAP